MQVSEGLEPSLMQSPVTQYSPQADLAERRHRSKLKLKSRFESIFDKYERDFSEIGDEIDLEHGVVVVDNGHLDIMEHDRDVGALDSDEAADDSGDELASPSPSPNAVTKPTESQPVLEPTTAPVSPHEDSFYPPPPNAFSPVRNPYYSAPPPQPQVAPFAPPLIMQQANMAAYDPLLIQQICQNVTAGVMQAMAAAQYPSAPAIESAWQAPPLPPGRHHVQQTSRRTRDNRPSKKTMASDRTAPQSRISRSFRPKPRVIKQSIWADTETQSTTSESRSPSPGIRTFRHEIGPHVPIDDRLTKDTFAEDTAILPNTDSSRNFSKIDALEADHDAESSPESEKDRALDERAVSADGGTLANNSGLDDSNSVPQADDEEIEDVYSANFSASTRLGTSYWTPDDDVLLLKLKDEDGFGWTRITKYFPNRTREATKAHWKHLRRKAKDQKRWSRAREQAANATRGDVRNLKTTHGQQATASRDPEALVLHRQNPEKNPNLETPNQSSGMRTFRLSINAKKQPHVARPQPNFWTIREEVALVKMKDIDKYDWERIIEHFPARSSHGVRTHYKQLTSRYAERKRELLKMAAGPDDVIPDLTTKQHLDIMRERNEKTKVVAVGPRHPFDQDLSKAPVPVPRPDTLHGSQYNREDDELMHQLKKLHKLPWREVMPYFPSRTIDSVMTRWKGLKRWYEGQWRPPPPYNLELADESSASRDPASDETPHVDEEAESRTAEAAAREPGLETSDRANSDSNFDDNPYLSQQGDNVDPSLMENHHTADGPKTSNVDRQSVPIQQSREEVIPSTSDSEESDSYILERFQSRTESKAPISNRDNTLGSTVQRESTEGQSMRSKKRKSTDDILPSAKRSNAVSLTENMHKANIGSTRVSDHVPSHSPEEGTAKSSSQLPSTPLSQKGKLSSVKRQSNDLRARNRSPASSQQSHTPLSSVSKTAVPSRHSLSGSRAVTPSNPAFAHTGLPRSNAADELYDELS